MAVNLNGDTDFLSQRPDSFVDSERILVPEGITVPESVSPMLCGGKSEFN